MGMEGDFAAPSQRWTHLGLTACRHEGRGRAPEDEDGHVGLERFRDLVVAIGGHVEESAALVSFALDVLVATLPEIPVPVFLRLGQTVLPLLPEPPEDVSLVCKDECRGWPSFVSLVDGVADGSGARTHKSTSLP